MSQSTPRVFVSSTVYDFRDLRSAVKLSLEEYGYGVHLSELNDFPQLPDQNTYDSCLRAIDQSDYFVLFVGVGLAGGMTRATASASPAWSTGTPTSGSSKAG